jgi:hypothetical protein
MNGVLFITFQLKMTFNSIKFILNSLETYILKCNQTRCSYDSKNRRDDAEVKVVLVFSFDFGFKIV